MKNGTATLEDSLSVSYKTKHTLTVYACMISHFSHIWLFVTLWTIAHQALLSVIFSRHEYQSGLPCTLPGDLPDPGIKPMPLMSPSLVDGFFIISAAWEAHSYGMIQWYTPLCLLKRAENLWPHKNWHKNIYSDLFHNCLNLDTAKRSFGRWMDKSIVVHPVMEYYTPLKGNESSSYKKYGETLNAYYKANLKWLHTVLFQVNDILEKARLWRQ